MTSDDIARFLQTHPQFFNDHPELLSSLELAAPSAGGRAVSLTERQLVALRDKIRQLENKLAELLRFGEENDEISEKVHRFSLSLLNCPDFQGLGSILEISFVDDFRVPYLALRLWDEALIQDNSPVFDTVSEEMRLYAAQLRQPYCGTPGESEIIEWFGHEGKQVRSIALMPLRHDGETFGVLALGSEEAKRFFPGMGTLYLTRIAELVAAAVRCHGLG
jgi:uncharacterized protein